MRVHFNDNLVAPGAFAESGDGEGLLAASELVEQIHARGHGIGLRHAHDDGFAAAIGKKLLHRVAKFAGRV